MLDTNLGYVDEVEAETLADYLIAHGVRIWESGEWVVKDSSEESTLCECSKCHVWLTFYEGCYSPNFCPHCGAPMKEKAMYIDIRKQELLVTLHQLEQEAKLLLERIPQFREDLLKVKTEEDANAFDESHNLEQDLKHISLF